MKLLFIVEGRFVSVHIVSPWVAVPQFLLR